jgi:hypothetical protein
MYYSYIVTYTIIYIIAYTNKIVTNLLPYGSKYINL